MLYDENFRRTAFSSFGRDLPETVQIAVGVDFDFFGAADVEGDLRRFFVVECSVLGKIVVEDGNPFDQMLAGHRVHDFANLYDEFFSVESSGRQMFFFCTVGIFGPQQLERVALIGDGIPILRVAAGGFNSLGFYELNSFFAFFTEIDF